MNQGYIGYKAYNIGWHYAFVGKLNPFQPGSSEYFWFDRGWHDAKEMYERIYQ